MLALPIQLPGSPAGRVTPSYSENLNIAFIAMWLFACSGALFALLVMNPDSTLTEASSAGLRPLLVPSLIMTPVLVLWKWRLILEVSSRHPSLVAVSVWIWLSAAWSVDPTVTLRRALSFSSNTLIVCFLVVTIGSLTIFRVISVVMLTILSLSIDFAAVLPSLAFMPGSGELQGIFSHKNGMGIALVVSAVVLAVSWHHRLLPRPVLIAGLAAVALLSIPAGSATTIVLLATLAALHVPLKVAAVPVRWGASGCYWW